MAQHTQPSNTPTPPGQWTTSIPYASENYLQTYDVFPTNPSDTPSSNSKYWLIYIHGGFFRDPLVDAASYHATVSHLHSAYKQQHLSNIAGYASINYRLSTHPDHPQASETPAFSRRQAAWPDHLNDVLTALAALQARYGFGSRYVLAGHSVGAQLALLASLRGAAQEEVKLQPPTLVLGMSGIYDFPLIHEDHPEYKALTFGAMREGEEVLASPARYEVSEYARAGVKGVVLAHSRDDGLVTWNQVERMAAVLGVKGSGGGEFVRVLELQGEHNDIWRDGRESSRAVLEALRFMAEVSMD
jgi:acetyl esterase/lipase